MAIGGAIAFLILSLWILVVAARRGVGWLLAIFFFPITQFILPFVEPAAVRPVLLQLLAIGVFFWGILGSDDKDSKLTTKQRIHAIFHPDEPISELRRATKKWDFF